MNDNRLTIIKDNMRLNHIKQELQSIKGVLFVNAFKSDEVMDYCEKLDKIQKIDFPLLFTEKRGDINTSYIENGYSYVGCNMNQLRWLIPYYNGENWWIEIEIENGSLKSFVDLYFQHVSSYDFTFFDLINNFLMDIELGENAYEYRFIKY